MVRYRNSILFSLGIGFIVVGAARSRPSFLAFGLGILIVTLLLNRRST